MFLIYDAQRKFALLRQFTLPQDLLPGSLSVSHTPLWQAYLPLRLRRGAPRPVR